MKVFPGGTLLFEGVRLLNLKIFEYKIGIQPKKTLKLQHFIDFIYEGMFISGGVRLLILKKSPWGAIITGGTFISECRVIGTT